MPYGNVGPVMPDFTTLKETLFIWNLSVLKCSFTIQIQGRSWEKIDASWIKPILGPDMDLSHRSSVFSELAKWGT